MTTDKPTTVEEALLWDVLADHADDTPRLILADWWEENGQEERAEFVRVQLEFPRLETRYDELERATSTHPLSRGPGAVAASCWCAKCGELEDVYAECRKLRDREKELWLTHNGRWSLPLGVGRPLEDFRRGFLSRVKLTLAAFMKHAADLFSAHPIEEVVLSDRTLADRHEGPWCWTVGVGFTNSLPAALFSKLAHRARARSVSRVNAFYDSLAEAIADLSLACVGYGRSLAGLPPLEGGGAG